ncbi:MAG: hypothetical protein M3409_00100 [Gemmatimonadota bacterium]|nr:hypothetical protein [Gemmatimonadota bacterium]
MNPADESVPGARDEQLLDTLLRDALPEIKLALGELIDQESGRALPDRYHRLLPETALAVVLRPDAAAALQPVSAEVERELSDSCTRHGSLYDRSYRVRMEKADSPGAPLFRVAVRAEEAEHAPAAPLAGLRPPPERWPVEDPDATRVEGMGHGMEWDPGRWVLVVQGAGEGGETTHPLREPVCTVGRRSDDRELGLTVALEGAAHVSRRQLALQWTPRGGEPGFRVYNLGLNALRIGGREVPGAQAGKGPLRLERLDARHTAWIAPDEALRIGESGPTLRVREGAEPAVDPDATVLG